jgi:hypothetical protein
MAKVTINMDSLKSNRDYIRHKIGDGNNIYRILPPFGDIEKHNNYPYIRWSIAWLQDPKSGKRLPFATPLTDGEVCPVQEYNDALNTFIEDKKAELKADGNSDADIKVELDGLRTIQWQLRIQHVYAYNACDQSGQVGILELKSTAHKAMKKMMGVYIKEHGQDPTSLSCEEDDSGVWFNVLKEGKGKDTEYSVVFNQTRQKMNGQLVKIDDRSALPDHVSSNYETLAYDLTSIYRRKSYDELKELLMFNIAILVKEVPEAALPGYEVEVEEVAPVRKPAPKVAVTPAPKAKVVLNLADDDEDEEVAPVRKPAPKVAVTPAPKPVQKRAVEAAPFDDDELSALTNEILGD